MKKDLRQEVKNDLTQGIDLKFDVSKLESNKKISKRIVKRNVVIGLISFGAVVTLAIVALPVAALVMMLDDSYSETYKKYYVRRESKLVNNTFVQLNNIQYPDTDINKKGIKEYTTAEKDAYINFTNEVCTAMGMENIKNSMISPVTLYGYFMASYGSISRDDVREKYDSLLTITGEDRINFYNKLFENNYNLYSDGVVTLHNGAFIDNSLTISQKYVDYLTSIYNEAFGMEMSNSKDVEKMVKWVNNAIDEKDFFKATDFKITPDTCAFLFSTLNFNMKWEHRYQNDLSYFDNFHTPTKTIQTKYMTHLLTGKSMYEYPDYVVFNDTYNHGYYVTYIIPKKQGNIYDLVSGIDVFKYDEKYLIEPEYIDLSVPIFDLKGTYDFKEMINKLGLSVIFDPSSESFDNMYENPEECFTYLQELKQINKAAFNEDGTIIKSINIGAFGTSKAAPGKKVVLNQPFIYIVRDQNGLPLYVGHLDDPSVKY